MKREQQYTKQTWLLPVAVGAAVLLVGLGGCSYPAYEPSPVPPHALPPPPDPWEKKVDANGLTYYQHVETGAIVSKRPDDRTWRNPVRTDVQPPPTVPRDSYPPPPPR